MKFIIFAAVMAVAAAVPYAPHALVSHSIHTPTIVTQHAKTYYAPITKSAYGAQINHLVAQPAPIAIPVPEPYAVPRAIPVAVPRAVPVPLVAHAAPLVTKSVVHAAPVYSHGYAGHGYGDHGYAGHGYGGHGFAGHGYGHGGYAGDHSFGYGHGYGAHY